jgi:hypothetical protein
METQSNVIKSHLWGEIYNIISKLPIKNTSGDAMDLSSVATQIEHLFVKYRHSNIDLNNLENKLDRALEKETPQTMGEYLGLKRFEIWSEGYSISGNCDTANLLGVEYAENWDGAIKKLMDKHPNRIELTAHGYTVWGCRLFDNEKDARKSFG